MVKIFFASADVGFSGLRKFVIPFCHVFVSRNLVEKEPFYFMISIL